MVELEPPQPTSIVAAAMGMRIRQTDIATRSVRIRLAGFCIQLNIMTMANRRANEAMGTSCMAEGGCIFVFG